MPGTRSAWRRCWGARAEMAFMNGISPGQYIPAGSCLHKLDPRCKILLTVMLMAAIFIYANFAALAVWGVLLLILISLSKIPARLVLRSARPILILIIFTSVLHLFWTPGEVILRAGFIKITDAGVFTALRISLRLFFLILYAGMLTLTTSPSELSDGLESIMSPFARVGLPAHEIAMMITIALRFIPTLFEETDRILKAQTSRGADFESGGLLKRAKAYIPVLIPLFVLLFQRADTLAAAMESRCYRGGRGRVRMYPLRWQRRDWVPLAVFAFVVIILNIVSRLF